MEDYKFLFKIVLVGNAGVGKTCLVRRFTQGLFPLGQGATIGVDFMIKTLNVNGVKVKLQIWDTAGQERFRSITQSYYRSAHSLILVYDISSQPSFDSLPQWCRDIEHFAGSPGGNSGNSSVVSSNNPSPIGKGSPSLVSNGLLKVLVGNKCDKEREVPQYIAESFAEANNFHLFMETSALEAENVEKLFHQIASILVERSSDTSTSIGTSNSNSSNNQANRLTWASSSNSNKTCLTMHDISV